MSVPAIAKTMLRSSVNTVVVVFSIHCTGRPVFGDINAQQALLLVESLALKWGAFYQLLTSFIHLSIRLQLWAPAAGYQTWGILQTVTPKQVNCDLLQLKLVDYLLMVTSSLYILSLLQKMFTLLQQIILILTKKGSQTCQLFQKMCPVQTVGCVTILTLPYLQSYLRTCESKQRLGGVWAYGSN